MEKKYKFLFAVLEELQNSGVLESLILVGSWCLYFYRILFHENPEIPLIRTTDIDFLIPNPPKIQKKADVPQILSRLGFDCDFDYQTGLVKYVHPDIEIQFLTPLIGREKDGPHEIKSLNLNAEGLRYMNILQDFKFRMEYDDIHIWLPEPEVFVLHKILISQKRRDPAKRDKDLMTAKNIGEVCLKDKNRRDRLKSIYESMPPRWKNKILTVIKHFSADIYSFLHEDDTNI